MNTNSSPKTRDPGPKTIVSAILLAAGRSERMGAFKPLLPFGKTTVLQSCINYLEAAGVEDIVVVTGHRSEDLRNELVNSRVRVALNDDPTSEMGTSIVRGAELLSEHAGSLLVALVDHPAVPPDVVTALINRWRTGARLVIPTWNGRGGHPVLIDLCYLSELLRLDQGRGLKSLFDSHCTKVVRLPVDSPYVAQDMDTWDDYRVLHLTVFGYPPPELG